MPPIPLHTKQQLIVSLIAAGSILAAPSTAQTTPEPQMTGTQAIESHPYAGLWITADGTTRHELRPNGRYVEARGARENAYRGRYEVTGDYIFYWDDTGFTADGRFVEGVLYHAGMVLRREP